jgi:hypothetical protein
MIRKPILLDKNTCVVLWVFKRPDEIEDIAYDVYDSYDSHKYLNIAAKQFISQLKGHWTPNFLKALRHEIDIQLNYLEEIQL